MNDYSKLVLGEEDSQTAPICNGQVREMVAEIAALRDLALAVRVHEYEGFWCADVAGKNWFDRRRELAGR